MEKIAQRHGIGQVYMYAGRGGSRGGNGGKANVLLIHAYLGGEYGVYAVLNHKLRHDLPCVARGGVGIMRAVYLRLSGPCYQLFALACVNKAPYHVYVAVNNVVLRVLMHAVHAFFREHYRYIRPCNAGNIAMVVYGAAHFVLYHVQRLALRAHLLAGNGYSAHALRGAFYKPVKVALPRRADNHYVIRAVVRGKPHAAYVVLKAAGCYFRCYRGQRLRVYIAEIVRRRQGYA